MYAIFTYIGLVPGVNVGMYSFHGAPGRFMYIDIKNYKDTCRILYVCLLSYHVLSISSTFANDA